MAFDLSNLISVWEMDESSGVAIDSYGSNTLTDNNTVTSGIGKLNGARQFTGSNSEYFSKADNADLSMGNIDWTITAWVKVDTIADSIILAKDVDTPANSRDYTLDLDSTNGFRFYINGGAAGCLVSVGSLPTTGVWYFLTIWQNRTAQTINLRVNDTTTYSVSTGANYSPDSTAEFRIGARQYAGFEGYFTGMIDQVTVWKRVLKASEISEIYNGGSGMAYPFATGSRSGRITLGLLR